MNRSGDEPRPEAIAGRLNADRVLAYLRLARLGRSLELLDDIDSTNRYALERYMSPQHDGAVIAAERQTAGRGRLGRSWHCPRGAGILATIFLFDESRTIDPNLLSLLVPVAIVDGIDSATGVRPEILWPNDLVASGRKLAGVLIDSAAGAARGVRFAIGIGINCLQHRGHFPPDLRDRATSLDLESKHPIEREAVLRAVLVQLDRWLAHPQAWQASDVCRAWIERATPLGSRVRISHAGKVFSGHTIDIDPTAALVVQLDEGGRRLFPAGNSSLMPIDGPLTQMPG